MFWVARCWHKHELGISPQYSKARVGHCELLARVPNQADNFTSCLQTCLKHLFKLQHHFWENNNNNKEQQQTNKQKTQQQNKTNKQKNNYRFNSKITCCAGQ